LAYGHRTTFCSSHNYNLNLPEEGTFNGRILQLKHIQGSQFPTYPGLELGDQDPVLKKLQIFALFSQFFALRMCSNMFITLCFYLGC
jgi:hypothetical protein